MNPSDEDRITAEDAVARLRAGDEVMVAALLEAWTPAMLRLARGFVSTWQSAEDVVQDTWIAVLRGIDRFEGRSSLRTWVYQILVNTAKTRAVREDRTIPTAEPPTATATSHRCQDVPSAETTAAGRELRREIARAVAQLPERQRLVITLRDVHGYTAEEVCRLLHLSPTNQRVLLHRARSATRTRLTGYLQPVPAG